jgi:deoxyribose-phosphate aldolase
MRREFVNKLTRDKIAKMVDYASALNANATKDDIIRSCDDAIENKFNAVAVTPDYVALASRRLKGSGVKVLAAVGFPWGSNATETKVAETKCAIEDGAKEIDMVINIGWLKSGDYKSVEDDIRAVVKASKEGGEDIIVKVIIETGYLTDDEKIKASRLIRDAGADFVKTCTGVNPGAATIHDIALIYNAVGKEIGVKASGSVNYLEDLLQLHGAGATRFGSRSVALINALKKLEK